jgi:tetratricopeptide (TPR) repeat protein
MIEQIEDAFKRQDYDTAAKLIKHQLKEMPEDPWVKFYVGRLYEVLNQRQKAEKAYRQLLQVATNNKVLIQARQGLHRLEEIKQEERQRAISQAICDPINSELGILVLEPINPDSKAMSARKVAEIMQTDIYTTRLTLPSRGWRLYRAGKVGELEFYGTQLQQADIPCFWVRIPQIQQIRVFQVKYFSKSTSEVTVTCQDETNQLGSLTFVWSEVTARVMGMLPIFEQVVDVNAQHQLERKTKTQDYTQFCDLHLTGRRSILRLYDKGYEFQQGLDMQTTAQNTVRINWNSLLDWLERQIPQVKVWLDFNSFAETAIDYTELLKQIPAHVQLLRREKTNWDAAFQLYSGTIFVRGNGDRSDN